MAVYFISADLEGITDVTAWCETEPGGQGYEEARAQMTREVAAACEAILDAGHQAVVRDGCARNLLHDKLPRGVRLMRGWACHPGSMMAGLDGGYAGALFIGYHAPAGTDGSPLAHTINKDVIRCLKVNGRVASEFTLNSLYAAQQGVSSIFLSGDETICRLAAEEIPGLTTVAVKECRGNSTFNLHPDDACEAIRAGVAAALTRPLPVRAVPETLTVEAALTGHQAARRAQALTSLARSPFTRTAVDAVSYTAHSPTELNEALEEIIG